MLLRGDDVIRLEQGGPPVGLFRPAQYEQAQIQLAPGDLLLLYTDGLIEARSATKEEFGIERVEQVLSASASAPVDDIYANLIAAVRAWTPVQQDDITLVVIRRLQG